MCPAKENYFKEQKPRSTNLDRSMDTLNTNITERQKSLQLPGVENGLDTRYLDGTPAVIDDGTGTTVNPQIKIDDAFTVGTGQLWDINGERVLVPLNVAYAAGNPLLTDSQVPPFPTPQSTGNTTISFPKVAGFNQDTFVLIKYLRTTDISELASVVPGSPFEYPKLDDGYEIIRVATSGEATTEIAGGAQFLMFIDSHDLPTPGTGLVSYQWPVVSASPTFQRASFGVNIALHASDSNAHHNKAHSHTVADASGEVDGSGAVLIGPGEQVKVGGENYRDNLAHQFRPGITFDPVIITDTFALLPQDDVLNVVTTGITDTLNLRQLRTGEKVSTNGRGVSALTGSFVVGPGPEDLYQFNLTTEVNNTYWLTVDENGAMGVEVLGAVEPIDKFIVGSFACGASLGKITGGAGGFTDLRDLGTVGTDALKSDSLKEVASSSTFKEALEDASVGVWTKYTIPATLLTSTGAFQDVPLFTLAIKGVVEGVVVKQDAAYTGGTLTAYTVEVGTGDANDGDRFGTAFDIFQAPGDTVFKPTGQLAPVDFSNTTDIFATFRSVGDQIDDIDNTVSGPNTDIYVKVSKLP